MSLTHAAKPAPTASSAKPGAVRRIHTPAIAGERAAGSSWTIADIAADSAPASGTADILPSHDWHEAAAENRAQAALRPQALDAGTCPGCGGKRAEKGRCTTCGDTHPPLEPATFRAASGPGHVARVVSAGGATLDPVTRAEFEPRFGRDFGAIRIHADSAAAESAHALGARAYTAGHHLVFGRGQFAPGTPAGKRLLAHELAHTMQALPRIARQEDPTAPRCRTGKVEGAGETLKPITIDKRTYTYAIWGRWDGSDTLASFRDRVLPKWVHWRYPGISPAETKNLVGFLTDSNLVNLNADKLQAGCFYAIPLEDKILAEARRVSGEIDREDDARKKQKAEAVADGAASPDGERAIEVKGDPGAMAGNPALATLYLDMLARYAGLSVDRKRAEHGLTREEVAEITKGNDAAQGVTAMFTQGWREYGAAGGTDIARFGFIEEALMTQRARGNFTALHNQLAYGKEPDGFGLYKRGTLFRYYDENGQPVQKLGGGYRDPGYLSMVPPKAALKIPITDRGLLSVLSSIKNVTLDDQVQIYQAAKGYWDNGDLLWPAVREGWDGYAAVEAELRRQLPALVVFLGLHGIATVLQKFNDPKAKGAGVLLEGMLKAAGKVFQIAFIGEMANLLYSCGIELSKVERKEGTRTLDALSQAHLEQAARAMRQLLAAAIAAGLTAAMVETARQSAITLGNIKPPTGGGGLEPAPAVVGGAPAPRGGAGAAAAAGGPPGMIRPPVGVPILPQNLESRGGGSGKAKPAKTPEEQPPAERPRTAKDIKLKQIEDKTEAIEQRYREIGEAQEAGRQKLSDTDRAALNAEKIKLAREAELLSEAKNKMLKELDDLSVTPYEKARAYSMSEPARKAVIDRAKGLDELSGKPADVTVDHIVPVAEIVEMDGWSELNPEAQRAILSDPENLIGMDRGPNSSKSDMRWADWKNGRRIYGDAVADRMTIREAQVRRMLQGKIKANKATR